MAEESLRQNTVMIGNNNTFAGGVGADAETYVGAIDNTTVNGQLVQKTYMGGFNLTSAAGADADACTTIGGMGKSC